MALGRARPAGGPSPRDPAGAGRAGSEPRRVRAGRTGLGCRGLGLGAIPAVRLAEAGFPLWEICPRCLCQWPSWAAPPWSQGHRAARGVRAASGKEPAGGRGAALQATQGLERAPGWQKALAGDRPHVASPRALLPPLPEIHSHSGRIVCSTWSRQGPHPSARPPREARPRGVHSPGLRPQVLARFAEIREWNLEDGCRVSAEPSPCLAVASIRR